MAETLIWILPLVPTVTALLMLTTRNRLILSGLDIGGSSVLAVLTFILAHELAASGP